MSRAIARLLYRWRLATSGFILVGALVLAPRTNLTNIDNDLTAWFSPDDPIYREYERFRDEFGGTRNLIIAIEAPSRDRLFSREGFAFIEELSGDIERVEAVERVSSLATATLVDGRGSAAGDDLSLDVRRLTKDLATRSPAEVGQRAIDDELVRGSLVSADGTVAAIVVFFDERRVDDVRAEVLARIHARTMERLPEGFRAHFNGSLEIAETYNRVTVDNQTKFTPPIALLTLVAIFAMFRSWRRTLVTAVAVLVSVIWTLGLYSLAGFTYNVLSSMIVPLVIVLAIADDVHIIQHYGEARRAGSAEHAFTSTVAHLFAPILGASGTTALGMATLATSSVVAVREFGLGSAIGVMVDFAISIVLVPTLLGLSETRAPGAAAGDVAEEAARRRGGLEHAPRGSHRGHRGGADDRGGGRRQPAPRRHEPHELLQPDAPAGHVGGADGRQARGHLYLSDLPRGPGGLAATARCAAPDGPA